MTLKEYFEKMPKGEKTRIAKALGMRSSNFANILNTDGSVFNDERCVIIERETKGMVTRADLRPDDWADIWVEMTLPGWVSPFIEEEGK